MALNFSQDLYGVIWNVMTRPMTVTPLASNPTAPAYAARCYFDTKESDILTEDGSIFSDSKTFIDIRLAEFPVMPMQGDKIEIPFHEDVPGGTYEVLDLTGKGNAGGIITLILRELTAPTVYQGFPP
jgi:hypothetical protein